MTARRATTGRARTVTVRAWAPYFYDDSPSGGYLAWAALRRSRDVVRSEHGDVGVRPVRVTLSWTAPAAKRRKR